MNNTTHPPTPPNDLKQLGLTCSVPTAARLLGIGRATAYKAAADGLIPSIRLGRRVVVPTAALNRLLWAGSDPHQGADLHWG
jgi:excisionase family DNA binding protein